jgi:nitrate reductase gamma subunit
MNTLLWAVFPYICLTSFFVGHAWRYRYDKFGWTTRSSQLYEGRLLSVGSPLFHFGILAVFAGHVLGLGVPEWFTDNLGITEDTYHLISAGPGAIAGTLTVLGLLVLVLRRGFTLSVLKATTPMDYVMYVVLAGVIVLGMVNTIGVGIIGGGHDYRVDVSIWFRSVFFGAPDVTRISIAPISYQVHALLAYTLVGIWPYTRLVHFWSVPLAYLARPYVVYRTPDDHRGARAPRRGWDRVGF